MSTLDRVKSFIVDLIAKYLVWGIFFIILIIWYYFPNLIESLGQVVIFWAPALILILGLILVISGRAVRNRRDKQQGVDYYEIIVTEFDFYFIDAIIYGGALMILIIARFSSSGVQLHDLIQALVFFLLTSLIKNIFYKKLTK